MLNTTVPFKFSKIFRHRCILINLDEKIYLSLLKNCGTPFFFLKEKKNLCHELIVLCLTNMS